MTAAQELPEFENPPVVEVVCGVLFQELASLLAPHLGLLWEKFKRDYPTCQEVPPLASIVERFDEAAQVQIEFTDKPPLPRIWLIHRNQNGIIQVQRDRFLHNWKKVPPDDEYPRYRAVIQMFRDRLATFEAFLTETGLGTIEPKQYELTYVNQIPAGQAWTTLDDLGKVFPDFAWRPSQQRFLPSPEIVNWRTSFVLPERSGRLHATIRTGKRAEDGTRILGLELTARGMPAEASREAMWRWFDLAHEWVVRGFADLTGNEMHDSVWRRTR